MYDALVDHTTTTDDEIVNAPDWLPLMFRPGDGEWFGADDADLTMNAAETSMPSLAAADVIVGHDRV